MKYFAPLLMLGLLLSVAFAQEAKSESPVSSGDVPLTIGMGSDTVWFKTGIRPFGTDSAVFLDEYGIEITYGPEKKVESISMSPAFLSTSKRYTLDGVGLDENKKEVVNKLGEPTKEFPKDKGVADDVYESVWVIRDQLLEVAFWQHDDVTSHKHVKDTVAWITLRRANF